MCEDGRKKSTPFCKKEACRTTFLGRQQQIVTAALRPELLRISIANVHPRHNLAIPCKILYLQWPSHQPSAPGATEADLENGRHATEITTKIEARETGRGRENTDGGTETEIGTETGVAINIGRYEVRSIAISS
jgi:hypothetical protein